MRRRRIILVLALAAVAAGLVLCWPRGPKEPVYEGKILTYWITQAMHPKEIEEQERGERAVSAIGTNAIPFLLHEFSRPISPRMESLKAWLSQRRRQLRHPGAETLAQSFYGFQLLHSNAAPALPTLAKFVGDRDRGSLAIFIMGQCGEFAIPYLVQAVTCTNIDFSNLMSAISYLGYQATTSESALPPLLDLLSHTNSGVRWTTARSLQWVQLRPDQTIPALTKLLSDSSDDVRFEAANSLGAHMAAAQLAVPELLRLTTNSNPGLAAQASNAVFRIDPAALPPREP